MFELKKTLHPVFDHIQAITFELNGEKIVIVYNEATDELNIDEPVGMGVKDLIKKINEKIQKKESRLNKYPFKIQKVLEKHPEAEVKPHPVFDHLFAITFELDSEEIVLIYNKQEKTLKVAQPQGFSLSNIFIQEIDVWERASFDYLKVFDGIGEKTIEIMAKKYSTPKEIYLESKNNPEKLANSIPRYSLKNAKKLWKEMKNLTPQ
jgi:hypothetical protein